MSLAKQPIYTMPSLFRDDAPRLSLDAALSAMGKSKSREFFDRVFAVDPDEWHLHHSRDLVESLRRAPGIKLRISLSDFGRLEGKTTPARESGRLLRSVLSLADLVVFSPAPSWPCNYSFLEDSPWPEFSTIYSGIGGDIGTTAA
jgi:hypothetical protein